MIFFAIFSITLLLSICCSLLLIKVLSPVISNTVSKIFNYEMQHVWHKYVQIALFIIGTSAPVDERTISTRVSSSGISWNGQGVPTISSASLCAF